MVQFVTIPRKTELNPSTQLRTGQVWRPKGALSSARLLGEGPVGLVSMRWYGGVGDDPPDSPTGVEFTLSVVTLLSDWELVPSPQNICVKQVWRRKSDGLHARVRDAYAAGGYVVLATPAIDPATTLGVELMQVPPEVLRAHWEYVGMGPIKATKVAESEVPVAQVAPAKRRHGHYFRNVKHLDEIDVYRVLDLFDVTDPCLQHAIKKMLVAGDRGVKDLERDVREAIDTLQRKLEMLEEDNRAAG